MKKSRSCNRTGFLIKRLLGTVADDFIGSGFALGRFSFSCGHEERPRSLFYKQIRRRR